MTEAGADFHDPLVRRDEAASLPARFFDRFMFNLHPVDDTQPSVILGYGVYPPKDVADGFAVISTATEQRNVRFSTELSATGDEGSGPLRFECVAANREWRLQLGENPTGVELDVTWTARTPYWLGSVEVDNADGPATSFDHLVQSGRYRGTITIDGRQQPVDGWYGQRDRSRGVRTMSGGQGLHIWFQAQFADRSVGFLLVEGRQGGDRLLLEGAVMHEDGTLDDVVEVRHDLVFDDGLDLTSGIVEVITAAGRVYRIDCDGTARGGYMSGGGYGGHHGKPRGRDHLESDTYPLDGTVSPRTVDTALTDRLTAFTWGEQRGTGIFEFAHSRSSSYRYLPTLGD
ncbi:DUF7064 domain-containing protein [Kribbia dieselivorans]|uniref:DUF7064 domain-containing protein n=1 Tax=Kribbia dieselivorans TaxID=331526 RepID=UPI0008381952|nr:hypothetical protein [Kribbia dieselivorans]